MDKLAVKGVKGSTLHLGLVAEGHVLSERERHIYVHTHIYIHIYIHTHIYIYIYIYIWINSRLKGLKG